MNTIEKFEQLKELELNSKTSKEFQNIQNQFDILAKEDPEGFELAFIQSAKKTLHDAKHLKVKDQIREVSEIISMAYIAKTYFNKSRAWLYHRLNELDANGKPVKFNQLEIDTLNLALKEISKKIGDLTIVNQ